MAWFYRILRNAMVDHFRRRASSDAAHEASAAEIPETHDAEIKATVCQCIGDVMAGFILCLGSRPDSLPVSQKSI